MPIAAVAATAAAAAAATMAAAAATTAVAANVAAGGAASAASTARCAAASRSEAAAAVAAIVGACADVSPEEKSCRIVGKRAKTKLKRKKLPVCRLLSALKRRPARKQAAHRWLHR